MSEKEICLDRGCPYNTIESSNLCQRYFRVSECGRYGVYRVKELGEAFAKLKSLIKPMLIGGFYSKLRLEKVMEICDEHLHDGDRNESKKN